MMYTNINEGKLYKTRKKKFSNKFCDKDKRLNDTEINVETLTNFYNILPGLVISNDGMFS